MMMRKESYSEVLCGSVMLEDILEARGGILESAFKKAEHYMSASSFTKFTSIRMSGKIGNYVLSTRLMPSSELLAEDRREDSTTLSTIAWRVVGFEDGIGAYTPFEESESITDALNEDRAMAKAIATSIIKSTDNENRSGVISIAGILDAQADLSGKASFASIAEEEEFF